MEWDNLRRLAFLPTGHRDQPRRLVLDRAHLLLGQPRPDCGHRRPPVQDPLSDGGAGAAARAAQASHEEEGRCATDSSELGTFGVF